MYKSALKISLSVAMQRRIKMLCDERNWSLSETARKSRVPKSSLSSLMNNATQCISTDNLAKLTIAFDISLAEFFNDELFDNIVVE